MDTAALRRERRQQINDLRKVLGKPIEPDSEEDIEAKKEQQLKSQSTFRKLQTFRRFLTDDETSAKGVNDIDMAVDTLSRRSSLKSTRNS